MAGEVEGVGAGWAELFVDAWSTFDEGGQLGGDQRSSGPVIGRWVDKLSCEDNEEDENRGIECTIELQGVQEIELGRSIIQAFLHAADQQLEDAKVHTQFVVQCVIELAAVRNQPEPVQIGLDNRWLIDRGNVPTVQCQDLVDSDAEDDGAGGEDDPASITLTIVPVNASPEE